VADLPYRAGFPPALVTAPNWRTVVGFDALPRPPGAVVFDSKLVPELTTEKNRNSSAQPAKPAGAKQKN
jgi:hypothetical protein